MRDEENGRDDRKSLVLSPPPPAACVSRDLRHTPSALWARLVSLDQICSLCNKKIMFSSTTSSPLLLFYCSNSICHLFCASRNTSHLSLVSLSCRFTLLFFFLLPLPSRHRGSSHLAFCYILNSSTPTPPCICGLSQSCLHRPLRVRPRLLRRNATWYSVLLRCTPRAECKQPAA